MKNKKLIKNEIRKLKIHLKIAVAEEFYDNAHEYKIRIDTLEEVLKNDKFFKW